MVRRMQGVPAHITYIKKKDEGGHRSRCVYYKHQDLCEIYSKCSGSDGCYKYKEKTIKEEKTKKQIKSKGSQNIQSGIKKGDTIKLFDKENDVLLTLTLVEESHIDVLNGKISTESSLGKVVLGKRKGDIVEIFTDKKRIYRITNDNVK